MLLEEGLEDLEFWVIVMRLQEEKEVMLAAVVEIDLGQKCAWHPHPEAFYWGG